MTNLDVDFVFHSKWKCLRFLILLLCLLKNQSQGLLVEILFFRLCKRRGSVHLFSLAGCILFDVF